MVDVEEKLREWPIRSRSVRDLGTRARNLAIDVSDVYGNHTLVSSENAFSHLEGEEIKQLAEESRNIVNTAKRLRPKAAFDKTARQQFIDMGTSNNAYLSWVADAPAFFGCEDGYGVKREDVNNLLAALYLPQNHRPAAVVLPKGLALPGRGAVHLAALQAYHRGTVDDLRRRGEILRQYNWGDASSLEIKTHMLRKELVTARQAAMACLQAHGLVSQDEVVAIERIALEAEALNLRLEKDANEGVWHDFATGIPAPYNELVTQKYAHLLRFLAEWKDDVYSEADGRTRLITVRESTITITQNRQTGLFEVSRGDGFMNKLHEIDHQVHWKNSSFMPEGLGNDARELALCNFPHIEGFTTWMEMALGIPWFEKNHERYGYSKEDVELARIGDIPRIRAFRARFVYQINKLVNPFTAARETASETGNGPHRSAENFPEEKLVDLIHVPTYDLGGPELRYLLRRVRQGEKKRLGSAEAGRSFVREHFPLIIKGMSMGAWSLPQLHKFMHNHYMPRLHELVGSRPPGSQVAVPVDLRRELSYR